MNKFDLYCSSKIVAAFVKEQKSRAKDKPKSPRLEYATGRIGMKKSNGYEATTRPTMEPVSYYKDIPQYSKEQYEWYWDKLPDLYEIIDSDPEYDSGYSDNVSWTKTRPIHRYFLMDRFKFTLYQLTGVAGNVPLRILNLFDVWQVKKIKKQHLWNYIRNILKKNQARLYYNRIPSIIMMLGLVPPRFVQTETIFIDILAEFNEMINSWNSSIREKFNRTYFINLRYVCLRLLEKNGYTFPYFIPLARMDKSIAFLDTVYEEFTKDIRQRKLVEDISRMFD